MLFVWGEGVAVQPSATDSRHLFYRSYILVDNWAEEAVRIIYLVLRELHADTYNMLLGAG